MADRTPGPGLYWLAKGCAFQADIDAVKSVVQSVKTRGFPLHCRQVCEKALLKASNVRACKGVFKDGEAQRIPRYSIQSAKGAEVRTVSFLNPLYANVSAVIGCVKWDMLKPLPITVVHNPLAAIALPRGILRANKEYVADDQGDYLSIEISTRVSETSGCAKNAHTPTRPVASSGLMRVRSI